MSTITLLDKKGYRTLERVKSNIVSAQLIHSSCDVYSTIRRLVVARIDVTSQACARSIRPCVVAHARQATKAPA
jgi:glycyl-tRNA synthetase beta subunit